VGDSVQVEDRPGSATRRWLLGLSILAVACLVAWALASYCDRPLLASWVLIAAIASVLHRFARVSTIGLVLWCVAIVAITVFQWPPIPPSRDWLIGMCLILGGLLPLVSGIVFLVAAARNRKGQAANCGACMLALSTLITWSAANLTAFDCRVAQGGVQETARTLVQLHQLGTEVESFRDRFGRLPTGVDELARSRREPMPTLFQNSKIRYDRLGENRYQLTCNLLHVWDRGWGWIVVYHGTRSPQRIEAVWF
jgi:hypothetical protein